MALARSDEMAFLWSFHCPLHSFGRIGQTCLRPPSPPFGAASLRYRDSLSCPRSLLRNIASVREFKWRRKKIYSVRNYRSLLSRMQNGVSLLLSLSLPRSPDPPPLSSPHFVFVFLPAFSRVLPRSFSTPPDCPSDHTGAALAAMCDGHNERGPIGGLACIVLSPLFLLAADKA